MRRHLLWFVMVWPVAAAAQPPASILDFVRQTFIHGVPYEAAIDYPTSEQTQLIGMLERTEDRSAWPNAVTVLGMIGDRRASEVLVGFIQRGDGRLDRLEYNAKTAAVLGLGYLLNRTEGAETLVFLRNGLDHAFWAERLRWESPFADSDAERDDQMVLAAVRALGLSGHPEAAKALENALTSMRQIEFKQFGLATRPSVDTSLAEALQANDMVRTQGLRAYLASRR